MLTSWHWVRFQYVAFAIVFLASSALAQHGLFSAKTQRAGTKPPPIVNPRTSSASPAASSLNVSGTWTMYGDTTYPVVLNQDQAGNITGTITINAPADACPVPQWPISGAVTGTNTFSFTATNPDGGDEDCGLSWQTNATMTSDNTASVTWNVWNDQNPVLTGTMTRKPLPVQLIDPVNSGLIDGLAVTQNVDAIAGAANPTYVSGVAADGVTQVIVEVTQVQAGDSIQLTLVDESGQPGSTVYNGGLFPLGGDPTSASSTLTFQAQNTNPPMAVALWVAPKNFSRGSQDSTSIQRTLTIQVQDMNTDTNGSTVTGSTNFIAVRPPVSEIHGLWANADAWTNMNSVLGGESPVWGQPGLVQPVDYSGLVPVTATSPAYSPSLTQVSANALGFSYNAPNVLLQLMGSIANYALLYNVAAVQADVIGHSMGGDIARTMPGVSYFSGNNNYGLGYIHKLITVGTPHLGSPLAVGLLPVSGVDPNSCVRKALEEFDDVSLQTATVYGVTVNGAVADLRTGVSGSQSLFPIAYIGATTDQSNLSDLNQCVQVAGVVVCNKSWWLHAICGVAAGEYLASDLTPNGWNQVFSGNPNDGIVALTSQLNNQPSKLVYSTPGIIHSPGLTALDFNPPTELDPGSGIPSELVNLLNEDVNGVDFFWSNP